MAEHAKFVDKLTKAPGFEPALVPRRHRRDAVPSPEIRGKLGSPPHEEASNRPDFHCRESEEKGDY